MKKDERKMEDDAKKQNEVVKQGGKGGGKGKRDVGKVGINRGMTSRLRKEARSEDGRVGGRKKQSEKESAAGRGEEGRKVTTQGGKTGSR